ncbi:hypothetical protein DFH09DRAFT_1326898 [Mycena vulgaris]|nr:hypothetical protein DFH09DRAFT_1326898 [Mycena vulgaris]
MNFSASSTAYGAMDDFDLTDSRGIHPVPIWSINAGDQHWCSFNSSPDNIAPDAWKYLHTTPTYPQDMDDNGHLAKLDGENYAVYYDSERHWIGWNPAQPWRPSTEDFVDPIEFIFHQGAVAVVAEYSEVLQDRGSDDDGGDVLAGYFIENQWVNDVVALTRRLRDINLALVTKSDFYGPNEWTNAIGDIPEPADEERLSLIHYTHSDAQQVAATARRSILGQLGFLNWFITIKSDWALDLSSEDAIFVRSLHLGERPKRGFLFDLSYDYHEMNIAHLVLHDVPVHYAWTEREEGNGRFVRYSPAFLEESLALRTQQRGGIIDLRDLPSFPVWGPDLGRYDVFFQDRHFGRVGRALSDFKPEDTYGVVDFLCWGVRPITNWRQRRAYAERFKGIRNRTPSSTGKMVTLFRQNPIFVDEPVSKRTRATTRPFPLTDFADADKGPVVIEVACFFDSSYLIREQYKNRCAPRGDRIFNSYNGRLGKPGPLDESGLDPRVLRVPLRMVGDRGDVDTGSSQASSQVGHQAAVAGPSVVNPPPLRERLGDTTVPASRSPMSPTRRSKRTEDLGITSQWARRMAQRGRSRESTQRRRSSRSLSPARRAYPARNRSRATRSYSAGRSRSSSRTADSSPYEEFVDAEENHEEGQITEHEMEEESMPSLEALARYQPMLRQREVACETISDWARLVIPQEPPAMAPSGRPYADEWLWVIDWMEKSYLVCSDRRSLLRMKVFAAREKDATILGIITRAIQFGIPFSLYIDARNARDFSNRNITPLDRSTLSALYAAGYIDAQLRYGLGDVALYGEYLGKVRMILVRPHAIAFISLGGILSFIAQLYDEQLVFRFLRGPSMQVTEYQKGSSFLHHEGNEEIFLTTDAVSPSEISLLIGHVATGDLSTETSLWPHPSLMEKESLHVHGAWTPGCYNILTNLRDEIMEGNYRWRTRKQWVSYFRAGNLGTYAPDVGSVPSKTFWDDGASLIRHAFPISWNKMRVRDIEVPESYEPIDART